MIICHSRKFIFVKSMKVAGTSLEIALSKYCGPGDILSPFGQKDEEKRRVLGYTGGQNNMVPWREKTLKDWARLILRQKRRRLYYSHDTAQKIKSTVPQSVWENYLKIAVVRNPFDYAISRYFWEIKRAAQRPNSTPLPAFHVWLTANPEILLENQRITHIDGKCAVDVMIRYEHFETDLTALSTKMKLPGSLAEDFAGISAKTSSRPKDTTPKTMYSDHPACKSLVEILCAEDIRKYAYHAPS